jgi:TRAP-type uncharacterized transport system fused permease subunit
MVSACGATIGYLAGPTGWAGRAWLLATATLFFIPGPVYDAGALLMLAGFAAVQFVRRRRAAAASPAESSPQ